MFGSFELDNECSGSALELGEALVAAQENDKAALAISHRHCHVIAATKGSCAFMFGTHAEQPVVLVQDETIMGLWRTEQN